MIGDKATLSVTAPYNKALKSVDWKFNGGAMQDPQDYQKAHGITTPLQDYSGTSATATFDWDEHTGMHTVSVTAHYTDNTQGNGSISVNLTKPTVTSFTDTFLPLRFMTDPAANILGLLNGSDPSTNDGEKFVANVTTPTLPSNANCQFAVLQTVMVNEEVDDSDGGKHTVVSTEYWLDDPISGLFLGDEQGHGPIFGPIASGQTTWVPPSTQPPAQPTDFVIDAPQLMEPVLLNNLSNPNYFKMENNFVTYLEFRAQNGIWVALSHINWEMLGAATYKGPPSGNPNDYLNINNWTVTITTPQAGGTLPGTNNEEFVAWNDCASNHPFPKL